MWIMTNDAFVSIVAPTPGTPAAKDFLLCCRARIAGHLESTFGEFAGPITEGAGTDYRFRCFIPRERVAIVMAARIRGIDYGNFKNSVKDKPYHDALMGVWNIMHRLQERFWPLPTKRTRKGKATVNRGYAQHDYRTHTEDDFFPPWGGRAGGGFTDEEPDTDTLRG